MSKSEKIKCPECGKEIPKRGLFGHQRLAHRMSYNPTHVAPKSPPTSQEKSADINPTHVAHKSPPMSQGGNVKSESKATKFTAADMEEVKKPLIFPPSMYGKELTNSDLEQMWVARAKSHRR